MRDVADRTRTAPEAVRPDPRDDAGATCRTRHWRQCTRTRLPEDALPIRDGLSPRGTDGLHAAGKEPAGSLRRAWPQAGTAARLVHA